MTRIRFMLLSVVCATAMGATPAFAEDTSAELPPAPLSPWRVSNHTIGDSYAHATDVVLSPVYRLGHRVGIGWHRMLGRDEQRVTIRLWMDPPPAPAPTPTE